jgi:hypothetical protein
VNKREKFSFVCFSVNNWEKRKARKQQFMIQLARRDDVNKVLYCEPPVNLLRLLASPRRELSDPERRRRWRRALLGMPTKIADKLYVCTPLFLIPFSYRFRHLHTLNWLITAPAIKMIMQRLGIPKRYVLWLYHPFDIPLLSLFKRRSLAVYDWAEEWSEYFFEFSSAKRAKIRSLENRIISKVNAVFVVSLEMLERAKSLNPRTFLLIDGTDPDVFRQTSVIPDELRGIRHPVAGYIGTVSHRFDVQLMEHLAKQFTCATFVIIGNVHHERVNVQPLTKLDNVMFIEGKEYSELGPYVQQFDIALLPYIPSMTRSFPTKILDYFAAGKSVISTDLVAIQQYRGDIDLCGDIASFAAALKAKLNNIDHSPDEKLLEIARHNSWRQRADEIAAHLREINV